jgi:hypothetical protein
MAKQIKGNASTKPKLARKEYEKELPPFLPAQLVTDRSSPSRVRCAAKPARP